MSIRTRLTRMLLLTIVPLVLAIGVSLFMYVRADLIARFDDGLLTRAGALSGMVKLEGGVLDFDFAGEAMPQYERKDSDEVFELWTLDDESLGRLVERSGSLGTNDISPRVPRKRTKTWDQPLSNGHPGRFLAMRFDSRPDAESEDAEAHISPAAVASSSTSAGPEMLVIVGKGRNELDRTLKLLAAALGGAGLLLVGGVALSIRAALARGLSPIIDLATQVESIGPHDLSVRLMSEGAPLELIPIAHRTNAMLDRLADAFEREKRLAASAAHELRTPIAEIRAVTELVLSRDRTIDEYRHALTTVLAVSTRMADSADAVLRLARIQSGRERPVLESMDLRDSLLPAWERWIEPLTARGIRITLEVPPGVLARADAAMLGVIFDNLCANAAEHTPTGGEVLATCAASPSDSSVRLRMWNTLPDGRAGDAHHPAVGVDRVEDREVAAQIHAGLGLVIAAAMAAACGGGLESCEREGHFEIEVRLENGATARC